MPGSPLARMVRALERRRSSVPGNRGAGLKVVALAAVVVFCAAAAAELVPGAAPPPAPPNRELLTVQHWQRLFDATAAAERQQNLRLSRSNDSFDFYNLSYQIDANVSMFQATGEVRYADFALTMAENMITSARRSSRIPTSAFRDGYRGWASRKADVRGQEVALFESYAWRYVTRLLGSLRTSPLYADEAFRTRYQNVLDFSEIDIFDKWYSRDANRYIYRERTHMAAHWAYIALDLMRLTESETLRARYREVVDNIDNHMPNHRSSLRAQLRPSRTDPSAYWWSDVWGRNTGYGQDIAHGNGVISYVVESRDLGAGWTKDELAGFSRTLTAFMIGRPGDYPAYVSGRGSGNGWLADGFVKLGRYDRAVQSVFENYGVQNSQYHATMALNAKILETEEP